MEAGDDELIAAQALGAMKNSAGPQSATLAAELDPRMYRSYASASAVSTQSTPSLSRSLASSSTTSETPSLELMEDDTFVTRVSNMPLVNTALRAYEQGKASSRVVKYGAAMMEGTVKTMTRPVIDRLPVNQLDDFAKRQLDRFYTTRPEDGRAAGAVDGENSAGSSTFSSTGGPAAVQGRKPLWVEAGAPGFSTSSERGRGAEEASQNDEVQTTSATTGREVQVVSRSTWQTVLLEAGGIGAAMSEESMKRLKYCLQWLQYANDHIDAQILLIRSFVTSINPSATSSSTALVPFESLQILSQVKSELVSTVRQVVDVVSKYAGNALPEPAKASVRALILMLPERWARAARAEAADPAGTLPVDSVPRSTGDVRAGMPVGAANRAAGRVMTLATESLDMMRGVTGVVKESLDRAETWVDRLQAVGLQRQPQQAPVSSSVSGAHSHWEAALQAQDAARATGVVSSSLVEPVPQTPLPQAHAALDSVPSTPLTRLRLGSEDRDDEGSDTSGYTTETEGSYATSADGKTMMECDAEVNASAPRRRHRRQRAISSERMDVDG